jgi:hypothetical protein
MQKRKLTISELKVDSFVTSLSVNEETTVNGGIEGAVYAGADLADSLSGIIQSLIYTCPKPTKTTANPEATPCPGTWTDNCPGGATLLGPVCPSAQLTGSEL